MVLLVWAAAKLKYTPPPHTQPPTDLYSGALRHVLEAPGVLADLQPRSLSTLLYAVASAPPGVASQHWPAVVTQVLPALLQPDKMASCNSQVCDWQCCATVGVQATNSCLHCNLPETSSLAQRLAASCTLLQCMPPPQTHTHRTSATRCGHWATLDLMHYSHYRPHMTLRVCCSSW